VDWIWRAFTRGHNVILMDTYIPDEYGERKGRHDHIARLRRNLGYTVKYAQRMQLAHIVPRGDLTSTGHALADPGKEYLVFQRGGGLFTVELDSGHYTIEWLRPHDGSVFDGGVVAGTGRRAFTPPFGGDAVLYLRAR
jgi:hypothetical protein